MVAAREEAEAKGRPMAAAREETEAKMGPKGYPMCHNPADTSHEASPGTGTLSLPTISHASSLASSPAAEPSSSASHLQKPSAAAPLALSEELPWLSPTRSSASGVFNSCSARSSGFQSMISAAGLLCADSNAGMSLASELIASSRKEKPRNRAASCSVVIDAPRLPRGVPSQVGTSEKSLSHAAHDGLVSVGEAQAPGLRSSEAQRSFSHAEAQPRLSLVQQTLGTLPACPALQRTNKTISDLANAAALERSKHWSRERANSAPQQCAVQCLQMETQALPARAQRRDHTLVLPLKNPSSAQARADLALLPPQLEQQGWRRRRLGESANPSKLGWR